MNRREFVRMLGSAPITIRLLLLSRAGQSVASDEESVAWRASVPPLMTWTYANGNIIDSDHKRASLARAVCRFPIAAVISQDQDHRTHKPLPMYDAYREKIRETNPRIKMLAHLNASESHTPSSPGQRVIHSVGGEWGYAGNEPQDNPGTIWFEKPRGRVVLREYGWGPKAMIDFRLQLAQDTLLEAMETELTTGQHATGGSRSWDGLFLDQMIVPGFRWGTSITEQTEMKAGLQAVLTRFRKKYPNPIVVGNAPLDYHDVNGEVNEGRTRDVDELASFPGHSAPEVNVYMFKPKLAASEEKIAAELARSKSYDAFFSYHYGNKPFHFSPWPQAFTDVLGGYPKWKNHLTGLGLL